MKSSTFSLAAIACVILAYMGAAALDNYDHRNEKALQEARDFHEARSQCGNSDWVMNWEGEKLTITCVRRKALNSSKVKP